MMLQLNPPLPVYVVGRGSALAHGWIDYGIEHHLLWLCADDKTGEVWAVPNPDVRLQWNPSMGRVPRAQEVDNGWQIATGRDLDRLARIWGITREHGESDAALREKVHGRIILK